MHSLRFLPVSLAVLAAVPASASNRSGDVHLSTFAGRYTPQNSVVNELGGNVEARMAEALGYGGQLKIWLNANVALAASGFYVQSSLDGQAFGATGTLDASVFLGGGRVVVGMGGGDGASLLNLSAGIVANMTDYGSAVESATHAAGVIGADLNVPLGRGVGFHLGVDDYIYDRWFEAGSLQTEPARQHDLVFFGGLTFYPGR